MGKSILIVEDDITNLLLMNDILTINDFLVHEATDGKAAIKTAISKNPDIILMDMLMPVMDGMEATRILKKDELTRNIPIIALTAFTMEKERQKIIDAGCDDYLVKPFKIETLLEIVNKYTI